jgi:hypothetical protein
MHFSYISFIIYWKPTEYTFFVLRVHAYHCVNKESLVDFVAPVAHYLTLYEMCVCVSVFDAPFTYPTHSRYVRSCLYIEADCEHGAEENIWTEEERSNRMFLIIVLQNNWTIFTYRVFRIFPMLGYRVVLNYLQVLRFSQPCSWRSKCCRILVRSADVSEDSHLQESTWFPWRGSQQIASKHLCLPVDPASHPRRLESFNLFTVCW